MSTDEHMHIAQFACDDAALYERSTEDGISDQDSEIRRRYITGQRRARLHQSIFRERVLKAYRLEELFCKRTGVTTAHQPLPYRRLPTLTRIKIDGFKNLVGIDVSFGPFTCIAGANAVGKSNLFDAIVFLSDPTEEFFHEAAISIRGDGKSGDVDCIKSQFFSSDGKYHRHMKFEAEFIIPQTGIDDLRQPLKASITFLKYTLELRLREDAWGRRQYRPTSSNECQSRETAAKSGRGHIWSSSTFHQTDDPSG